MLEVTDLQVTYGGAVRALRGVSCTVPDGKVVAVLGSNGAGKTTLLRTISSTLELHRGKVEAGTISLRRHQPGRARTRRPAWRWAWCRCPRAAASSAASRWRRTCGPAAWAPATAAPAAPRTTRVYDLFPVLADRRARPGRAAVRR